MNKDNQISETKKQKKPTQKNKKKNYSEIDIEKKKLKEKINNEMSPYEEEENNINSKNKKYKKDSYEFTNNDFIKEEYTRKEEKSKSKSKKINSKKNKNSIDSNTSEDKKKTKSKKLSKLKKIIKKMNSINNLNLINKYFQRWILQTFDVIEEDSEGQNDQEKKNNQKEEEEEEEEEENDYGGDLEEIEERAADEEESVITSVQSKTKVKRANDILFALRKIIKYKNIFFRYFIRWYNAVEINAPTNEYKKIRKEKKLSNNIINNKKNMSNVNSNLNNSNKNGLKRPIYEVSSEERIDELKSDAKANLKNIIELKGNKKKTLKKYYDIWYNVTFNHNSSPKSVNSEQNEFIFTYHGTLKNKNNIMNQKIDKHNLTSDNFYDYKEKMKKNKEIEGFINKSQKDSETSSKKSKTKTQCYVKKKIYSIKKESTENENKKKAAKKKPKNTDIIKNIIIKIYNKKLLYKSFEKWKKITLNKSESNSKEKFKKKQSSKVKRKNSNSRNKVNDILIKKSSKESDSFTEGKGHKKNNLSIDAIITHNNNKQKINLLTDENQILSESYSLINKKLYNNDTNSYQINSDNSLSSINLNSKSSNDILQIRDKELKNKKYKKATKKDENKKFLKNKERQEPSTPQTEEMSEEEMEKIKKMVEKICRIHKNQRAQRYLLIKPPKIIRKNPKDKLIEGRQSFSTINYSLRFEKFQKKLYKLILKNTCRKEPLMYSFDNWFNKTFNSENYTPFLRRNSIIDKIKVQRKTSKAKKIKKNKKISSEDETKNKKTDRSTDKESNNSISKDNNKSSPIYMNNNENPGNKSKRDEAKYTQINELLNQGFDSESSDNRLLFNDKKKNLGFESFEQPRKSSVSASKKFQKNKPEKRNKSKDKEIKKNKDKNIKKETEEKVEESPRQRK